MDKPVLAEELIIFPQNEDAQTDEQVIRLLCARLAEHGYIEPSYQEDVLQREREFPTALPTKPFPTAIPHADHSAVLTEGSALAILSHPVGFKSMEDPSVSLEVRLVWLLAIKEPSRQVPTLQWIAELLQDQHVLAKLTASRDASEAMNVLQPLIKTQARPA